VDLHAREKPRNMGNKPRHEGQPQLVQNMGRTMHHQGLEPRIAEQNLKPITGSWVVNENNLKVSDQAFQHSR
jgi:hypothetical protein